MTGSPRKGNNILTLSRSLKGVEFPLYSHGEYLLNLCMAIPVTIKLLSLSQVIIQLFRRLDAIKVPAARAMIIWMLGEYSSLGDIIPKMLTTILKYLAWCFRTEAVEAKLQILTATVKVSAGTGER